MGLLTGVLDWRMLVHLTETLRKAVDSGLTVAVPFVDFRKAFDSISHPDLLDKLRTLAFVIKHWVGLLVT